MTKAIEIGITPDILHEKFIEALSNFTGDRFEGWVLENQLNSGILVKEFEINGKTFQCQLNITRDEDEFF